ncbi:hypothetical protein QN277_025821 [Acacia crassicarpa]|uniref:Uncharacterized protein n=1 Tax=Acacia crassicarpa TaxID=499986 RepID=A0AAE1K3H4_9FABA|nr:hypothetical protein QN277_025821 [Acacia crassicarpa]
MGKGLSKLETSPLVSMCKERKGFIKAAIYSRYDLTSAYVMYLDSLLDISNALNRYVEDELVVIDGTSQVSGSDSELSEESSHIEFSSSDSSVDLHSLTDHVHSDMEVPRYPNKENQGHSAANLSIKCTETRQNEMPGVIPGQSWCVPSSHPHHSYQENTHTNVDVLHENPAHVKYDQRILFNNRWENPQSHHIYPPQLVNQSLPGSSMGFSYYDDKYLHYPAEAISLAIPSSFPKFHKHVADQNTPSIASPTPPPPQVSTWDFSYFSSLSDYNDYKNLHFCYSYDTWSNISDYDEREVREREGIPDLEDETEQDSIDTGFDEEGLRRGNLNSGDGTSSAAQLGSHRDAFLDEEEAPKDRCNITEDDIKADSEVFASKNLEPRIVEGKSSDAKEAMVLSSKSRGTSCVSSPVASCTVGLKEAIQDIKDEFENLFNFGKEFSATIEVGKLLYHSLSTRLRGFASPVLGLIFPPVLKCSHPPLYILLDRISRKGQLLHSTKKINNQGDVCAKFADLSSTLEQLYAWEKRLYREVMGEEKLRILYEKKYKRLKDLDGRGAESDKINDTWASVKHIQSEINVVVAYISVVSREIDKLRDHKLLPELYILIEGLIKLWKYMGSCQRKQFQIITKAKSHIHILDPSRNHSNPQATLRLEKMILNWGTCFSNLVNTLKDVVKYLNEWLLRCMLREPEETVNGAAPPSPSRIGAPPIFNLCYNWYHAIDSISEMAVSKAFSNFASSLHHLYEKQKEEQTQKARVDDLLMDCEDRLKSLHKRNAMFHRNFSYIMAAMRDDVESAVPLLEGFDESLTVLGKRLSEQIAKHRELIRQVNDTASSCLQVGLSHIFEVLECFCLENLKAYELLRLPNGASHA